MGEGTSDIHGACGVEAVRQSACLSVGQQVFIYLSGGAEQPIGRLGHMVSLSAVFPPHTILHTTVP